MPEMSGWGRWFVNRSNAARSARLFDLVEPSLHLPEAPRVLEIGAGAGGLSARVQERLRPRRLVATDYDPAQVEVARKALTKRFGTMPASMELRQADALHLPFEDGSFDCVFAMGVFHHVEARPTEFVLRPAALRETRRVLRPGGTFVYTEFTRRKEFRGCLQEQGFTPVFQRQGWGRDLGVYRSSG
jgi:ubiquinone/menaquinone biosynthesis C-methylase UbiE